MDDRLESFLRKHSAQMQTSTGSKRPKQMAVLPGSSLQVGPLRKPRSAEQLLSMRKSQKPDVPVDVKDLQPGVQKLHRERNEFVVPESTEGTQEY